MTAEKKHLFSPALKRMIDMGMQYDRAYIRRCMAQRYGCSIKVLTRKEYHEKYGLPFVGKIGLTLAEAAKVMDAFNSIPSYVPGGVIDGGYKVVDHPSNAELIIPNNLRNYKKIDTAECVPGQACDLATCRGRFEYCAACDMVI